MTGVEERGQGDTAYDVGDVPAQQASSASHTKPVAGLGIRPGSRSQSSSINTRVWQALNEFARNQEDGAGSETTSKLPSTAAPSVVEEATQSPNRPLQERLQQYRPMGPPVNIPTGPVPRQTEEYSATEVATPSIAGTPDFRALASSSNQARTSPGHLQPGRIEAHATQQSTDVQPTEPPARPATSDHQQPGTTAPPMSTQEISDLIRAHGHRLEVLESLSFSHVPVEEIQERFELFDGRILDLEQWRTDHDRAHASPEPARAGSSKRRRLLPTETGSFGSDGSFDGNAAAHTEAAVLATLAVNAETHPRIDALESRVSDLENTALPSFARPWQVEVVMLPWGREVRGIWFSSIEATQHSLRSATQASDEWTGAHSAPKLSFKSSASGAWTTESIQAWANEAEEWLSPKACGPSGTVFQRLASRGFVREVVLTASDSRHIMDVISNAFGHSMMVDSEAEQQQTTQYQGLMESFVPLRKVRKSSRLRFLGPAEMVTSASWTAGFLDSSVFMKVNNGQRRLYVTTPEAYYQSSGVGWSWPQIRKLPTDNQPVQDPSEKGTTVAIESCWTYHEHLDRAFSERSSFVSHESQWSTRSQLDNQESAGAEPKPLSPNSEAPILRQRTVSLPSSASASGLAIEPLPKRRVASFETGQAIPIVADELGAEIVAKRRRISKSPEAERRGVNFTPRWSREPPSPFTSDLAADARSQGTSSRKRGATPFGAYATPHSANSNYVERLESLIGDGDTEANTEIIADHSDHGEEEWQGVDDDQTNLDEDDRKADSAVDEEDINENDIDEGLTIYER